MSIGDAFDDWAADGRDKGMEERHWHTAKHALARMPIESGDRVLDLGCGSGYAGRAIRAATDADRVYGLDRSPGMLTNARSYTDDDRVGFVRGDFTALPFADDTLDHAFSMEAIYYASDVPSALAELRRVLRPGGTAHVAVDFYANNPHTEAWQEYVDVPMTWWTREEYRAAFRDAGFRVAVQDAIPDREVEIPAGDRFPTDEFETRDAMVEHYREYGTLLTVGVVP
ncbi:class I SAM-dependent methyltransferase [Halococcoides cellulosivorans]|uniref:SAM-dependent methyltransferase n=1 Tax=Halococcoides cellulosivorans TaxID=1679096 RepID=A0A2R4WZB0_9EURY|nr:class I SAM-dependent methyltransferase [Halococcoides cellulosivorans]AWB26868.1 SAM-dependent methyltransferase [Halococcoides cellulosivorans]